MFSRTDLGAILSDAKIQKILKDVVKEEEKLREHRVYHGSGADFDEFDSSHMGDGEVYGFTVGGKIYIDPRIAKADTPIHEYTHLWSDALRNVNPEEWKNVVNLMKGTWAWDYVKKNYPELKTDVTRRRMRTAGIRETAMMKA